MFSVWQTQSAVWLQILKKVCLQMTIKKSLSRISAFLGTNYELRGFPVLSVPSFFPSIFLLAQQSGSNRHPRELKYTYCLHCISKNCLTPKSIDRLCICNFLPHL